MEKTRESTSNPLFAEWVEAIFSVLFGVVFAVVFAVVFGAILWGDLVGCPATVSEWMFEWRIMNLGLPAWSQSQWSSQ